MHYGISNDSNEQEIRWALKTFVQHVRGGEDVPDHLLEFVAGGVERYLKGAQPWSKKSDPEIRKARKYGLVLALVERGAKRSAIAAHLGISENRVSEIINEPVPLKYRNLNQREFLKKMWLIEFKGKKTFDMLCKLEEFRKSEN